MIAKDASVSDLPFLSILGPQIRTPAIMQIGQSSQK